MINKETLEFFIKAKDKIEKQSEISEYKFVREYVNVIQSYYSIVFEMILYGIAEKIGVDPKDLKKSFTLSEEDSNNFFKGNIKEEKLDLIKGLLESFKKKIGQFNKTWAKYKLGKNKKGILNPMKIKKPFSYNTNKEIPKPTAWDNLNQAITEYLDDTMIEEEIPIRASLIGKLINKLDVDKIKKVTQRNMSWDDLTSMYGEIPNNYSDAGSWFNSDEKEAVKWVKENALEHLSIEDGSIKKKMISLYKKTILNGIQNKESKGKVIQNMFWVNPESKFGKIYKKSDLDILNRDWIRIVNTETNIAINNGYLNAVLSEQKLNQDTYMVFSGGIKFGKTGQPDNSKSSNSKKYVQITCPYCEKSLGKIVKLIDQEPENGLDKISGDKYTDTVIWPGKNNVGRSQKDWWLALPAHPNCWHQWTKINPSMQNYDKETGMILLKSPEEMDFGKSTEFDLLKSGNFIPTPTDSKTGKVDYKNIPQGMSCWITINGNHVPITRHGDKFSVDFKGAENSGYKTSGLNKQLSHLEFDLNSVENKQKKKPQEEKREKELKELSSKQYWKKVEKNKYKFLVKVKKKELNKKEKEELKKLKSNIELDNNIDNKVEDITKDLKLKNSLKEIYKKVIEKQLKNKEEQMILNKLSGNKDAIVPEIILPEIKNKKDENEFRKELYEKINQKDGQKLEINEPKKTDKKNIKEQYENYKRALAEKNKFKKELLAKKVEEVLKIGADSFDIKEIDLIEAEKDIQRSSSNTATESIYTIMGEFWTENLGQEINMIADRTRVMHLNGILGQFAGFTIDTKKLVDAIGSKKSINLIVSYLKNKFTDEEYNKVIDKIENYFEETQSDIEENALNRLKTLREDLSSKGSDKTTYTQQLAKYRVENLINQRNTIGTAYGMLNSTSEILNIMKKTKEVKPIEIELNKNKDLAELQLKGLLKYEDRQKLKIKSSKNKNTIKLDSELLEKYISKNEIDKNKIEELNKIKFNSESTENFKPRFKTLDGKSKNIFKAGIKPRTNQRNDSEFIMASGGSGIISRGTGGGKTLTLAVIQGKQLMKNPNHTMVIAFPKSGTKQQFEEYTNLTNLPTVMVPEGLHKTPNKLKKFLRESKGKLVVISHDEMAKAPHQYGSIADTFAGDEFHKIILNDKGDVKNKAKEILAGIKNSNKILTTATLFKDNPGDIYNSLKIVKPDVIPDKINFKSMFGDRITYDVEGKKVEGHHSITDMNFHKNDLIKKTYGDVLDKFVTYDTEIKAGTKRERTESRVKISTEMGKDIEKFLGDLNKGTSGNKSMKGYNKFVYNIPKGRQEELGINISNNALKDKKASIWKNPKVMKEVAERSEKYINKVTNEKMKYANTWELPSGKPNSKTEELVKNVSKYKDKQVVYVDDKKHFEHLKKHLLKNGIKEKDLFDKIKLDGDNSSAKIKEWENSKSGVLFISKGDEAMLNLQKGDKLHIVGNVEYGMDREQLEGRIFRDPRTGDAEVINYSFDSADDEFLNSKHEQWIENISSLDKSKEKRAEEIIKQKYEKLQTKQDRENRPQFEEFMDVSKQIGRE